MPRPRSNLIAILLAALVLAGTVVGQAPAGSQAAPTSLDGITTGTEFRQPHADLLRLYYAVFDRAPDVGGALYWIDRYNDGETLERIADHMSQSPEFVDIYGDTSTQRFVETLYANVLGRTPDVGGFEFWTSGLESAAFTRLWVLRHFAASSEFVADHRFPGEEDAPAGPPLTRPVGTAGPTIAFSVEIEDVLGWSLEDAQREIVSILGDPQSWIGSGTVRFRLVEDPAEADVRIRIATPATVDARCRPLRTVGRLSCRNGSALNLNSDRWATATSFWPASLGEYRTYLINHEMGHFLGHGHENCGGIGQLAPVMQQQTKSLQGCLPNGWPYPA